MNTLIEAGAAAVYVDYSHMETYAYVLMEQRSIAS